MKKKFALSFLFILLLAFCAICGGCSLFGGLFGGQDGDGAELIRVGSAVPEGGEVYLFADKDTWNIYTDGIVVSEGASWAVFHDEACTSLMQGNRFADKDGSFYAGNYVFYIRVTSSDAETSNTYKLTIYKSFSVAVDYYDGDEFLTSHSVYTGEEFTPAYVPELVGYTFGGWHDGEGSAFSSGVVWGDIKLYLSKTAITYKATLDANGGEAPEKADVFIDYGSDFTLPTSERYGYHFAGWYADDTQVTDGTGKAVSAWNFAQDTALTARWTPRQFLLTILSDDSSAGSVTGAGGWNYMSMASATAYPKDGYTFVGWYDEAGELLTRDVYYAFEVVEDRTLTAKWGLFTLTVRSELGGAVSVRYAVSFDLNGGSGTAPDTQYVTRFQGLAYPSVTPVREGYLFRGWFTQPNPSRGEAPYNFSAAIDGDVVLYAAWYTLPKTDNIKFLNVGSAYDEIAYLNGTHANNRYYMYFCVYAADEYTVKYHSEIFDFKGVSLVIRNTTAIEAEEVVFEDSYNNLANHSHTFAVKPGNVYRIELWREFDDENDYWMWIGLSSTNGFKPQEGGTVPVFPPELPTRSGTQYTLVAYADPNCEFLGWYDETGALVSSELVLEITMPYSTKVYTAKWQINS